MTHYTQNSSMVPKAAAPLYCPSAQGMVPSSFHLLSKLDASGDFPPSQLAKYSGPATMANVLQNRFWEGRGSSGGCWLYTRAWVTTTLGPRGGPWLSIEPCRVSEGLTLAGEGKSESFNQGQRSKQKRKHQ